MNLLNLFKAILQGIRAFNYLFIYPSYAKFGYKSPTAKIQLPARLVGTQNIYLGDDVNIGSGATIFAPISSVTIKEKSYSGPNLFISTGNHLMRIGRFSKDISDKDKIREGIKNRDVIIEEDVWIGANVTIMCERVGRGSIIGGSALVNRNVLPYSTVAGIPAKFIKFRWTIDEILLHERNLYPENKRYSREELESIFHMVKS